MIKYSTHTDTLQLSGHSDDVHVQGSQVVYSMQLFLPLSAMREHYLEHGLEKNMSLNYCLN